ncbi:hypothetical protein E8E14_008908 [Neopestalotiopsis sp. 37M]|nr:hypothetical protein E8E14_008908 [Neopestalotiopsis sp. 37M]
MSDLAAVLASLPASERDAFLDGPALTPPNGIIPNFDNPPNGSQNRMSAAVISVCLAVMIIVVAIRAYVKIFCVKKFHIEDLVLGTAFGTYMGFEWVAFKTVLWPGYFIHQWDVRVRQLADIFRKQLTYQADNFYVTTLALIKVAILLEWTRIFAPKGTRTAFFWICHVLMWLNVVFYVAVIVSLNFSCSPRAYYWDKTIPGGKCLNVKAGTLALTVFKLVSDVVVLLAPHRIIWGLKLPFTKRLGISFIFAMSLLCVAIAAGRVVNAVDDLWVVDVTYALSTEGLTAHAEMTILFFVICASSIPKAAEDLRQSLCLLCRVSRTEPTVKCISKNDIIHLGSPATLSSFEEISTSMEEGRKMQL